MPADAQIAQVLQQCEEIRGLISAQAADLSVSRRELLRMADTQELILKQHAAILDEFERHHEAMRQVPVLAVRITALESRVGHLEGHVDFLRNPPIPRNEPDGNGEAA